MKYILALPFFLLAFTPLQAQFESYLGEFYASTSDKHWHADLYLINRAAEDRALRELGVQSVKIPKLLMKGTSLNINYNNSRSFVGQPYIKDGKAWLPVYVYYDNNTAKSVDDHILLRIPFEVDEEVVSKHYKYQDAPDDRRHYKKPDTIQLVAPPRGR